jgi:CBS domain-containing protein
VTLLAFGGVSQMSKEATTPDIELLLATAGLLFNLLIVAAFYAIHSILVYFGNTTIDVLIQWLAFIFFMLALFHFIPVLPLGAGRFLRAILWKTSGAYYKITRMTSLGGQITGLLTASGGIYLLVTTQQWFTGILLIYIAWILFAAARQSYQKAVLFEALDQIAARDVIAQNCPPISKELRISQLVKDCVLTRGQRFFVVADDEKLQGIITMRHIRKIPKQKWSSTQVGGIMTPSTKIITADAQQSAASVLNKMDEIEINEIPILEKDKVVGFIARDGLILLSRIRSKFKR